MRSSKKTKTLSALSMAAAATLGWGVNASQAATLSLYYNAGGTGSAGVLNAIKIGTSSSLTGATAGTTLAINPSSSAVTITIPLGDYLEFGVSAILTNNPNPIAGQTLATTGGGSTGISAGPSNLGLSELSFQIKSSDVAGYTLTPLQGTVRNTFGAALDYYSTAKLNSNLVTEDHDVSDVLQTGTPGGGDVGDKFGITPLANSRTDPATASGQTSLDRFTTVITAFEGFNPDIGTQIFAVDVMDASGQATIAELDRVLAAIDGSDGDAIPSLVSASLTSPVTNPFGSQYNLFLTFSGSDLPSGLGTPAEEFWGSLWVSKTTTKLTSAA